MFSKLPGVNIKIISTQKELSELSRFRYQIYNNELKRYQKNVDHNHQTINEPLDHIGIHLIAEIDDQIIGSARVNLNQLEELEPYNTLYGIYDFDQTLSESAIVTKFMVSKKFRNTSLSVLLAMACFRVGVQNNVKYTFIDCYPHLVKYFQKLGFKVYKSDVHHPEFGKVTPLVLHNQDQSYLASINSPFYNIIREHTNASSFSN